jgi:hypothetical protein
MQEQQRLALLDAQTHTQHTAAVICTTSSTQHPPTGGGRGKAQSARRLGGLGGPPRPASPGAARLPQQPATSPCYNQLSQGLAVPLRPNTCSAEGIGPRKGEGRAEEAPSLLPLPRLLWWEARPKILEACGAGACFVVFSTIRFAPSSG